MRRRLDTVERAEYRRLYDTRQVYIRVLPTAGRKRLVIRMLADADKQIAEFKEGVYGQ